MSPSPGFSSPSGGQEPATRTIYLHTFTWPTHQLIAKCHQGYLVKCCRPCPLFHVVGMTRLNQFPRRITLLRNVPCPSLQQLGFGYCEGTKGLRYGKHMGFHSRSIVSLVLRWLRVMYGRAGIRRTHPEPIPTELPMMVPGCCAKSPEAAFLTVRTWSVHK
ncbi:hypothetical protein SODALDRAFT_161219 [Sodiomyces alkalinus F11]|uniref:Uncharacterized protein n=1 Tax=Sodiomyces alkalinus (strain CBS 110278 / VKM F-3762 / F11) TaxID=1314773 RepID=A0A3N2PV48_SODAK|nr:hypothetical protein SODALDRAFT_161219 [Sodiomyces alkalinus F11]ROT38383.1 hypothetical protein SODALDRAFT_161219 [Sodiomyces alkalinus F11]